MMATMRVIFVILEAQALEEPHNITNKFWPRFVGPMTTFGGPVEATVLVYSFLAKSGTTYNNGNPHDS